MDAESIEKYTELAKRLNVPQSEMIEFFRSLHKDEREERRLQRDQEKQDKLEEKNDYTEEEEERRDRNEKMKSAEKD